MIAVAAVAPAAFPMLMHIIKSPPAQYSPSVRRRVVTIMRCFFEIFTHVRDDPAGEAHKILQAALPEWLNTLPQSFSIQGWMMRNGEDGFGIEISILRIFHIVVRDLYKVFPGLVRTVVEIVWGFMQQLLPVYAQRDGQPNGGGENFSIYIKDALGDDGEALNIDVLMVQLIEFLATCSVVPTDHVRSIMKPATEHIIMLIPVLQLSNDQLETLQEEPNDWIARG